MPMTLPYYTILFDLEGTLIDSQKAILNGVDYTLQKLQIPVHNIHTLKPFLTMPIADAFQKEFNLTGVELQIALQLYNEYEHQFGWQNTIIFDEAQDLLHRLHHANYQLAAITKSPTAYALKTLDHLQISQYFNVIIGSDIENQLLTKSDMVGAALEQMKFDSKEYCIMIGDTVEDIEAAKQNGIDSIGVTYGEGKKGDLESVGATYIVHTINSFSIIFGNRAQFAI